MQKREECDILLHRYWTQYDNLPGKDGTDMKLLHTGDLHLDSAFADSGALGAPRRRECQRAVLRRIFDLARKEACDMILIAGDFFDSGYVTAQTASEVLQLFRSVECPVVIAPGNHDPYTPSSFWRTADLPENVFVFTSPELQRFDFDTLGISVYGYAFVGASLTRGPLSGADLPKEDHENVRLLCAHGDYESPTSRYAPLVAQDIARFGFAYAALGHIHNLPDIAYAGNTTVCYCGFAEGRSYDELGDGGVWLVEIRDEKVSVERKIVSCRRYLAESLDVSDCETREEILEKIRSVTAPLGNRPGTCLRLRLCGTAGADILPRAEAVTEQCASGLESLTVRSDVLPPRDLRLLEKDVSLKGEFYRRLAPLLSDRDETVRRRAVLALGYGLSALEGRDFEGK